jgi:hypothetical protein
VVNGLAFLCVGLLHQRFYYLVGLVHFVVAALMPRGFDLAALVHGRLVVVSNYQPVNTHSARTLEDFLRWRED